MHPRVIRLLAVVALVAVSVPARATVDAFLQYTTPYQQLQTDDTCMTRQTMLASIGIPAASLMEATFSPNAVYNQNSGGFINTNVLATAPAMVPGYVSDSFSGAVWEYSMTLDVSALSAANGSSLAGRTQTVRSAKLALLAMSENMRTLSNDLYRLRITFFGLPNQTGLPGTRLYAVTQFPYSAPSALLAAYRRELINSHGTCPAN